MTERREREQISVPLDPAVRGAIERVARREDRTVAAQVRDWIAAALSQSAEAGAQ
jgi:hypothetical protein